MVAVGSMIDEESVESNNETLFNSLDINNDSYLSYDEIKVYKNILLNESLELFKKSDTNGDNLINGMEWNSYFSSVAEYLKNPNNPSINSTNSSISHKSNYRYNHNSTPAFEEWVYINTLGYDEEGFPIDHCTYYTSGDDYLEPGVYDAIGNDWTVWQYNYEDDDWRSYFRNGSL